MTPQEDFRETQAQVLAIMRDDRTASRTITLVNDDGKEIEVEAYPANGRWNTPEEDEVG